MTITQTTILVKPSPAWDAALARHIDRALWVQPIAGDGTSWLVVAVESYAGRTDGSQRNYTVTVDLTDPLATHVACECVAGEMGIPCQHSAAALREAGAFPYPQDYRCDACGAEHGDSYTATVHYLSRHYERPPLPARPSPAVGAGLLLGAKADRLGRTT